MNKGITFFLQTFLSICSWGQTGETSFYSQSPIGEIDSFHTSNISTTLKNNRLKGLELKDGSIMYDDSEKSMSFKDIYIDKQGNSLLKIRLANNVPVIIVNNVESQLEPFKVTHLTVSDDSIGEHSVTYGWSKSQVKILYNDLKISRIEIEKDSVLVIAEINRNNSEYYWDLAYYFNDSLRLRYDHSKNENKSILSVFSNINSPENSGTAYFRDGLLQKFVFYGSKLDNEIKGTSFQYSSKGKLKRKEQSIIKIDP